jgi:predicted AAA+ superfamily ATPase
MQEIQPYIDDKEIIIILGARRVGKTTLLTQIKKFLIQKKVLVGDQCGRNTNFPLPLAINEVFLITRVKNLVII